MEGDEAMKRIKKRYASYRVQLGNLVQELASKMPAGSDLRGVEVGVHRGDTSGYLLERFPCLTLHMVDPWDTPMRHCPDRMVDMRAACDAVEFAEGRARVYKCTSSEVAALSAIGHYYTLWLAGTGREYVSCSKLSSEFHFVFIDTEHTEESVRRDIDAWWPLVMATTPSPAARNLSRQSRAPGMSSSTPSDSHDWRKMPARSRVGSAPRSHATSA